MSLRQRHRGSALQMRVTSSSFVNVTFVIVFASCRLASAKVTVNVDDFDYFLEYKRKGKEHVATVTHGSELSFRSCGEQQQNLYVR
jgi:hypothetical protein